MPDFLIGLRHGAADRDALQAAGLRVGQETFGGRGKSNPLYHDVCVTADDEAAAEARVIAALGWDDPALGWDPALGAVGDLVVQPSPRPCEDYTEAHDWPP
jgi:hypothetical protein